MSFFELELMRRALIAAALVGMAAPAIGVFLVQRRLSLMGDGIGHVAFAGVAAGFLFDTSPVLTALVAAVGGAVVIEMLRERGRTAGDVALAVIFYGGVAAGVLMTGLADASNTNLLVYLLGSVLTVGLDDLVVLGTVSAAVLLVTFALRKEFFALSYDEEVARASGLPVRTLNLLIACTAAVTVAVAMQIVGILLVAAMLVLPVAAAQQIARSFRGTMLVSISLGLVTSVAGLVLAYYLDVRPGATIVLCALTVFAVSGMTRRVAMGH